MPLFAVLFLLWVAVSAVPQDCKPPVDAEDTWRLSVPPPEELPEDVGEPETITQRTEDVPASEGELAAIGDMHVLYDVPLHAFARVLDKLDTHSRFIPRLERARVECANTAPLSYANVYQHLSFSFLFFGNDYEYRAHIFVERDMDAGVYRQWWTLDESLDGQIAGVTGSWFLTTVTRNGREYTYARYATRTVFAETVFGLKTAFRRFGARDLSRMFEAVRDEAAALVTTRP
jgi:hypothetical protein